MPKRPFRNVVLSSVILLPLLLLLVGCLYIPFQHTDTRGAKQDFRPLMTAHGEFVSTQISKSQVESLLGKPAAQSDNGCVAIYLVETGQGLCVYPQCFSATWNIRSLGVLSLQYTDGGVVEKANWFSVDCTEPHDDVNFFDFGGKWYKQGLLNVVARVNGNNGASPYSAYYIHNSSPDK